MARGTTGRYDGSGDVFLPGHAQLLVRYWWRRFHPKCASGGAVERIDRARVRGIWWRGNAKRVGVLLIKVSCCEFSGIATVSAPGCTPRNNHGSHSC